MSSWSPLRFEPLLRRYLWGGRRLESLLGKRLPPGDDYAESWELVDHGADQSVVRAGPHAGMTLAQLLRDHPADLLGVDAAACRPAAAKQVDEPTRARFPLLFKFLDAHQSLSVQVHPTDAAAALQSPPDLGKTEAWVIVHADPGAVLYAGLKRGFDRPALEREVNRGTTHLCLQKFEPRAGDCFFIPAGTVHALGAGLVVAEIQQSSDSTFRLYDWNRVGKDGQPRPLHIAQSLDSIDFHREPVVAQIPRPTERPGAERLVECDKFVLERWHTADACELETVGKFHVVMMLDGAVRVADDPVERPLVRGETCLIPAACGRATLDPLGGRPAQWLVARLP